MTDRQDPSGFDTHLAGALGTRNQTDLGPCPDAETLAAWADGTLDAAARADCLHHVADCVRCQAVLAMVDPVQEGEAEVVHAEAAPATEPGRVVRFPWRKVAWVSAPLALAASALLAVWVSREASERPATPREEISKQAKAARGPSEPTPEPVQVPPQSSPATSVTAAPPKGIDQGRASKAAASPSEDRGAPTEAPLTEPVGGAVGGAVAAAPPPAPSPSQTALQRSEGVGAGTALKSMVSGERDAALGALPHWASPSGQVTWSIAPGGRLVRRATGSAPEVVVSTNAALAAGAALSDDIAWVVGKGGVVWRTTDGRSWQRVQFPTSDDLVTVALPGDADTATVTTAGGRRFTTRDGGKHWTP